MAAYEEAVRSITLIADAAIAQFVAVEIDSSGQATVAGAASDDVVGVTQEASSAAGDTITVALPGCKTKWTAGGDVTQGGPVTTDASGKAVDAASTERQWGYCLNDPGADGEVAVVLFTGNQGDEA